ncbi:MAG: septal ring lytic transglycosylase RlpA family protein [Cyanobacteria bacterium P01_A01_bin.135]
MTGDERQVGDALQESASLAGVSQADSPETGTEAVKVGEYQSQDQLPNSQDDTVATIYAHQVDGRQAATLYVKDIPILTTLGPTGVAQTSLQGNPSQGQPLKMGQASGEAEPTSAGTGAASYEQDPVWRATAIAALLNQAHRNQLAPETITAHWDSDRERYVLKLDGELFVTLDERLLPPDTTGDAAEDILQMANRLRRQFGGEPLTEVEGRPQPARQVAIGPVRARFSGMASWYGPGFHGRRSASGEIFNQHALTAAHPSLPFGTLLQVTNANTGRTVTVRVNDRGPFSGRRVIDLSAAAAQAIGMMRSGVAPVRVEVVSRAN